MKLAVTSMALGVIAAAPMAAHANSTVKDYHAAKAKGGIGWERMKSFIDGAGSGYVAITALEYEGNPVFCIPRTLSLSTQNLLDIIDEQLRLKGSLDDNFIEMVLLDGFKRAFPCDRKDQKSE